MRRPEKSQLELFPPLSVWPPAHQSFSTALASLESTLRNCGEGAAGNQFLPGLETLRLYGPTGVNRTPFDRGDESWKGTSACLSEALRMTSSFFPQPVRNVPAVGWKGLWVARLLSFTRHPTWRQVEDA